MKNKISPFLLLCMLCLQTIQVFACDCGKLLPLLTKQEAEKSDIIVIATIQSIQQDSLKCSAVCKGNTLYKGLFTQEFEVTFDCRTSCAMPFIVGQQWLFYLKKNNEQRYIINYCDRNRLKPLSSENDEYTIYTQMTWEEEILFLEKNFPKKDFSTREVVKEADNKKVIDATRPLEHATNREKIILVLVSFVGMLIIYFIVKKVLK
jgi:hypothetical protein